MWAPVRCENNCYNQVKYGKVSHTLCGPLYDHGVCLIAISHIRQIRGFWTLPGTGALFKAWKTNLHNPALFKCRPTWYSHFIL